jgi:hypothetical protein
MKPTQEVIQRLFHYDPETGVLTRKQKAKSWNGDERKYGKVGAGRITELGYVVVGINGVNYNVGCVAWAYVNGEWPKKLKYLNGNQDDNRIANLAVYDRNAAEVKAAQLTQSRLKELLHYEPETGWFTWRVNNSVSKVGERAGGLHGFGYRTIGLDYNKYLEHQLAWLYMTGEWPTFEVDHENKIRNDNRWINLRDFTKSENGHNTHIDRRSKTGYRGVYPHGKGFRSRYHIDNKDIDLGWYNTIAEARVARLLSELKHSGKLTSYNEELDTKIPAGDGMTVNIQDSEHCIYLIAENEIPHALWNVALVTDYVAYLSHKPDD